ncbi:hypothetical protein G9A89_010679 [Geosiphon pyriformis]|nr:hypothetical protein G9A89_010679 [Geosiphon pyriformis]
MALYTNARVRRIDIKLILNSRLASSIIMKQLIDQLGYQVDCTTTVQIITVDGNTKIPIEEIDNFFFKINEIQIPTKVFIIKAIQYQALVGNNCYPLWAHILETIKNGPLLSNTTVDLVYWKDLDDRNNKTSRITCHASHVMRSCLIKDSGIMCLTEEEHVTKLCDLIFNLPPKILYPITKLPEPKKKKELFAKDMLFQEPN